MLPGYSGEEYMSGLTPKLQDATLRKYVGGQPVTYTNSTVKCRFVLRTIRSRDGSTILSRAQIILNEAITTKDRIIYNGVDYVVSDVNAKTGLGGSIMEYEAWV
jgi:hypothetical protein